ncbi:MAG: glycoside hydrolase family 3 C-terminal domain-containing protein [Clostridiales bacterium]|nr:glycoside hydrolase family 3 C-terminal domain-containing protein [Clostridiales bacterium]
MPKNLLKKFLAFTMALAMSISINISLVYAEVAGEFQIIAKVLEYGTDAVGIAIKASSAEEAEAVLDPDEFSVRNTVPGFFGPGTEYDLTVSSAYLSATPELDPSGEGDSGGEYIILELANSFTDPGYSILYYNFMSGRNNFELASFAVSRGDSTYALNSSEPVLYDNLDNWELNETAGNLKYQLYTPEDAGSGVPLVVWIHGMGEGGSGDDAGYNGIMQILGNEGGVGWVDAASENPSLKAFVAAPQAYSSWDWADGGAQRQPVEQWEDVARIDGMIKEILSNNPGIDSERIYVAGCSMGGGQTFAQLIYSESTGEAAKFAGAFPICPAMPLTPEDAEIIKDVPIWVFQAANDTTVNPDYVREGVNYLIAAGAKIQYTEYDDVYVNGNDYNGHWSWVRVLNNEDYVIDWLFDENKSISSPGTQLVSPRVSSVTEGEGFSVTVAWEKISGADGYRIYESVSSGFSTANNLVGEAGDVSSYTLEGVSTGEHTYLVTALAGGKESSPIASKGAPITVVGTEPLEESADIAVPSLSIRATANGEKGVDISHPLINSADYSTVAFYYTTNGEEPSLLSSRLNPSIIFEIPGYFTLWGGNYFTGRFPFTAKVIAVVDGKRSAVAEIDVNPDEISSSVAVGVYPANEFPASTTLSLAFPATGASIYYRTGTADYIDGYLEPSGIAVNEESGTLYDGSEIPLTAPSSADEAFVIEALAVYESGGRKLESRTSLYYVSDPNFELLNESNIQKIVNQMSLEERISILGGIGMNPQGVINAGVAGATQSFARYGIPYTLLSDGPAGVRMGSNATVWMSPTGIASSWDVNLVSDYAKRIAEEAKHYAVDIMLAPALNIQRNPMGGRDFEYYSEDPVVSGEVAAAYTKALQESGVGVSIKHFAANNQENFRTTWLEEVISERALREIYLKGFETAVKESDPWTVMSSYNQINGYISASNKWLLTDVLRGEWGFDGYVMSDWGGALQPVEAVIAQNDLAEMNGNPAAILSWVNSSESESVKKERVALISRNASNILGVVVKTPAFKGEYEGLAPADIAARSAAFADKSSAVYNESAPINRDIAAQGMVLLKNEGEALPIAASNSSKVKAALVTSSIAEAASHGTTGMFGATAPDSVVDLVIEGGGSAQVVWDANYAVTLNDALSNNGFDVVYNKLDSEATDASHAADIADVGIFVLSRQSSEGADNPSSSFDLSDVEKAAFNNFVDAFAAQGKKVIVLINSGASVNVQDFNAKADAILVVWLPGTEGANAIADILTGKVNPSGKLTQTFPLEYDDSPSIAMAGQGHEGQTWGTNPVFYDEGVFVGYRYFDTFGKSDRVAYAFGHGLSYTDFEFSDLSLEKAFFDPDDESETLGVSVTVTNTGSAAGKETVQLYIGADSYEEEGRPVKELKHYAKTGLLEPGESEVVTFEINKRDLQYFDDGNSGNVLDVDENGVSTVEYGNGEGWKVEVGTIFTVIAGNTSDEEALSSSGVSGEFVYGAETEEATPTPTEEATPTPTEEATPTPTEGATPTPPAEATPTSAPYYGPSYSAPEAPKAKWSVQASDASNGLKIAKSSAALDSGLISALERIDAYNAALIKDKYLVSILSGSEVVERAVYPVKVSVDVSALSKAQKEKLTGIYISSDLKSYKRLGGELSEDDSTFVFWTYNSGEHAVIITDVLQRITLIIGNRSISANGANVLYEAAPYISSDGRTMVPIRVIAETLGAKVDWIDSVKTAIIQKGGTELSIAVNQPLPDGMGTAAIVNDRTFVPIRYIAEKLDANVVWDDASRTVRIYQ